MRSEEKVSQRCCWKAWNADWQGGLGPKSSFVNLSFRFQNWVLQNCIYRYCHSPKMQIQHPGSSNRWLWKINHFRCIWYCLPHSSFPTKAWNADKISSTILPQKMEISYREHFCIRPLILFQNTNKTIIAQCIVGSLSKESPSNSDWNHWHYHWLSRLPLPHVLLTV